ncbi:PREDICTED: F-box protein At5g07610-like [Fragaria vesca subsp. vesca]|uniref:F-box protein At5g07610-like n=1 Tax=Fragaria vesca subsp. vesca TaxID=101020 RepID=UPI0002C308F7|nr:PREDICTED: F-box protein At5g07610-like [Fragaria vesca subsp. vesca]
MAKRKERKMSSTSLVYSEAAEAVANMEELLTQILESVPLRSLARFKCVSKHWQSLINNLRTLRNPRKKPQEVGFRLKKNRFQVLQEHPSGSSLLKINDRFRDDDVPRLKIIQSCNGLFLCRVPEGRSRKVNGYMVIRSQHRGVYVVNPTTKQLLRLCSPTSWFSTWESYSLAFEPSKSPHYTSVCVTAHHESSSSPGKVHIYSSKTRKWKHVTDMPSSPSYGEEPVYCNDAVHWIRDTTRLSFCNKTGNFFREESDVLHYFDIGEESFRVGAATPPVPMVVKNIQVKECRDGGKSPIEFPRMFHRYFGECSGRLYLIEIYSHCKTQFDVVEMEKDYSGWFVKYHVDLNPMALPQRDLDPFVILCLSCETERGKDDEVGDSSTILLLHMPGKVISYDLRNKNFMTSSEVAIEDTKMYHEFDNYPYMETLACV